MAGIQQAVNSTLASSAGVAIGLAGKKIMQNTGEVLEAQKAEDLAKIEKSMTEAELKGQGVPDKEAENFVTASTLGLKVNPEYQARYDELQKMKAEKVLQSETYVKAQQSADFRKRLLNLSQRSLNQAMTQQIGGTAFPGGKK